MSGIEMYGCRENNLKNVNLVIPYGKIVSFIGVSGSGKSTLVFDTLHAEGKRRYIESLGVNESYFLSKIKKPDADYFVGLPPSIALVQSRTNKNPRSTVGTISQTAYYLQVFFSTCGEENGKKCTMNPSMFNLNSPQGVCDSCEGTGEILEFDETLIWPNQELSLEEGGLKLGGAKVGTNKFTFLDSFLKQYGVDAKTPIKDYSNECKVALLFGQKKNRQFKVEYPGIIPGNEDIYRTTKSIEVRENLEKFMHKSICEDCHGTGYNQAVLNVTIDGKNIDDFSRLSIDELIEFFESFSFYDTRDDIWAQFKGKFLTLLKECQKLGVGYLTLSRKANTLSGGEVQRLKIVAQISSEISGVVYVLDEPTSGLHSTDIKKVLEAIQKLNTTGNRNTVVLVEHTKEMIKASDYIFEIGPGAGVLGGNIIAEGTVDAIIKNPHSLSGKYLSGESKVSTLNKNEHYEMKDFITLHHVSVHNLKDVDVTIPLGAMVAITGVSGSGKSSLVFSALYQSLVSNRPIGLERIDGREKIKNVILCDQSSIGISSRSNPLTYLDIYGNIRKLFAEEEMAKKNKWKESDFSFNVAGGRCEACKGEGSVKVNMGFLPEMSVICDECDGKRFKKEILEVKYKGLSIFDVLELSIVEAMEFFKEEKTIVSKLEAMEKVGLGYLKLGQPTSTLSGGESQRLKLANEIAKTNRGSAFIIFDEPTKGLHFEDVKKLLGVMKELVLLGHTLISVEHNLDVISSSDYVIDIGPGAGKNGGMIVGTGTPKEIAKLDTPTGNALKQYYQENE